MNTFKEHEIDWTDEKIKRLWDYYSRTSPYKDIYFSNIYAHDILNIMNKENNLNHKIILDFGCGAGHLLNEMSNQYTPHTYYALDFSRESIEKIRKTKTNFKIETVLVKNYPSKIPDNAIDICFMLEVVEHLNDDYLSSSLDEIYRILKPNGYLLITTPNNETLNEGKVFCPNCGCIFHKWQHQRKWNVASLTQELISHHFKTKKIIEIDFKTKSKIRNIIRFIKSVTNRSPKENLLAIVKK